MVSVSVNGPSSSRSWKGNGNGRGKRGPRRGRQGLRSVVRRAGWSGYVRELFSIHTHNPATALPIWHETRA